MCTAQNVNQEGYSSSEAGKGAPYPKQSGVIPRWVGCTSKRNPKHVRSWKRQMQRNKNQSGLIVANQMEDRVSIVR